jgi:hypothetical protein
LSAEYLRLLDPRTITANDVQPRDQVADLGAYRQLMIHLRLLKVGTAGNLLIQDAAVNEEDAFRTIATISLSAASNPVEITAFLRYVRWKADTGVTGSPVVVVDLVAKE